MQKRERFQNNQIVELIYKNSLHLAEYIGTGIRIHNNKNTQSYIFLVHTNRGTNEISYPIDSISEYHISEPSQRLINKSKKQLKQLQAGVISVGGILEKLGKINQKIHE